MRQPELVQECFVLLKTRLMLLTTEELPKCSRMYISIEMECETRIT